MISKHRYLEADPVQYHTRSVWRVMANSLIKDIAPGYQSIECTLLCVLAETGGVQEIARVVRDENRTSVGRRVTRNHAVTGP